MFENTFSLMDAFVFGFAIFWAGVGVGVGYTSIAWAKSDNKLKKDLEVISYSVATINNGQIKEMLCRDYEVGDSGQIVGYDIVGNEIFTIADGWWIAAYETPKNKD